MRTYRRQIAGLSAAGVRAVREIYTGTDCDVLRVAALVEIAAAASALARTVVKLRHLDPDLIAPHIVDRVDLRAVLGRGRWLPTMVRHVPEPPPDACTSRSLVVPPVSRVRRRPRDRSGQPVLFPPSGGGS